MPDNTLHDKTNAEPIAGRAKGEKTCPLCGAAFICGMEAGQKKCWCADLPAVMPLPGTAAGCYCPDCLRKLIEAKTG